MGARDDQVERIIPVLEEHATVSIGSVVTDRLLVRMGVETRDETVERPLRVEEVSVERVPIGREVEVAPEVREEEGVLIVPVIEEELVVRTRLILKEELRIRRIQATRMERRDVRLRREVVSTEHLPPNEPSTQKEIMPMTNNPTMPEHDFATASTGAYDLAATHQIVAVFETFERARAARDRLLEEGIPATDMDVLNRDAETGYSNFDYERTDEGFWGALKRFFVPGEHAAGYAEGLRRGHAILVVRPPQGQQERITEILEGYDPIDFDAREEEWRRGGWTGEASLPSASATARPVAGATAAGGETIPVVEESLRVGKRVLDRGGVRVRSYVVERPVEETVTLRDERVDVQRRPVDRPAGTVPEDAFRERTIEMTASGEEPVVQKDARVVEEVAIRKDASERTETVRDTVRKTEVEVEDTRTGRKDRPTSR